MPLDLNALRRALIGWYDIAFTVFFLLAGGWLLVLPACLPIWGDSPKRSATSGSVLVECTLCFHSWNGHLFFAVHPDLICSIFGYKMTRWWCGEDDDDDDDGQQRRTMLLSYITLYSPSSSSRRGVVDVRQNLCSVSKFVVHTRCRVIMEISSSTSYSSQGDRETGFTCQVNCCDSVCLLTSYIFLWWGQSPGFLASANTSVLGT